MQGLTHARAPQRDHAVLLLHGLSSSPLELRFLARYLDNEGFATSVPVLDGYSALTPPAAMEQWIDAALAEFDRLAERHARVSICGLSMGATLALAVARERPSAQSLMLLSVTFDYDGWATPWYRCFLDWAYYTPLRTRYRYRECEPYGLRNEALRTKIARTLQKDEVSEIGPATISMQALHEANRLVHRARKNLARIQCDSLIVHAIDDETASPRNARFVETNLGASFVRTIWLDDSYHMITSDNEREVVARECASFLRESVALDGDAPVLSKALARRRRLSAALSKPNR